MFITSSQNAFKEFKGLFSSKVEEVRILNLTSEKRILRQELLFRGTVDQCPIFYRDIFRSAILANASSFIIAHNHPFGDAEPSQQDLEITKEIHKCARIIGIEFLDHLILSKETYWSWKDSSLLEKITGESVQHR